MDKKYKKIRFKSYIYMIVFVLVWNIVPMNFIEILGKNTTLPMDHLENLINVQNDDTKGKVNVRFENGQQKDYLLTIEPYQGWEISSVKNHNGVEIAETSNNGEGIYEYRILNIETNQTIYITYNKVEQSDEKMEVKYDNVLYQKDHTLIVKKGNNIKLSSTRRFEIKYFQELDYQKAEYYEDIKKYCIEIINNKEIEILKIFEGRKSSCKKFYTDPKENQKNLDEKLSFHIVKEDIEKPNIDIRGIQNEGYYVDDKNLLIDVTDKESGIDQVEYVISDQSQSRTIYTLLYQHEKNQPIVFDLKNLNVPIHVKEHNYENVEIKVKVRDRAGNVTEATRIIHINCTKPTLVTFVTNKNNQVIQEDSYTKADAQFHIEITDRNFDPKNVVINGKYEELIWKKEDGKYCASIKLNHNKKYFFVCDYVNKYYPKGIGKVERNITIDTEPPYGLQIEYQVTTMSKILKKLGIYNTPINVILKAKENTSGIDQFIYTYKNKEITIPGNHIQYDSKTNTYFYTFKIQPQYKGHVTFSAYDKVGLAATYEDDEIIVDSEAPHIEIQNVEDGRFYNQDQRVVIQVNEKNYRKEDVENQRFTIQITKDKKDIGFQIDTNDVFDGTYQKTLVFHEDGEYKIHIQYIDCAGNKASKKVTFIIDQTKPKIQISYDQNEVKNKQYFNKPRNATVLIKEHNFDEKKVFVYLRKDGKKYENIKWEHEGDYHKAVIHFLEDGKYEFNIACVDQAGNDNSSIDYGGSIATNEFIIDQSAPTKLNIAIDNESLIEQHSTITFHTFYKNEKKVILEADCGISGEEKLEYQKVDSVISYKPYGKWTKYDKNTGIKIKPNEKCIIYFKARDRAGNESIVHSTGIIVDDKNILVRIENQKPSTIISNKSMSIDVKASECKNNKEVYSGIHKISYCIYTLDTKVKEKKVIFDKNSLTDEALLDDFKLAYEWNGKIFIDSQKFNSNHVIVEITCMDNAGNKYVTSTKDGEIKIDVTIPTIDVEYNNNKIGNYPYFNISRIATITVTERNFNPKDVRMTVVSSCAKKPKQAPWRKIKGTNNYDDTRWITTISYVEESDYLFDISYQDSAGNLCKKVNYHDSVAPKRFTIDKTRPTVHVVYDNNSAKNKNYYQQARVATIIIDEINFAAKNVKIHLDASIDGKRKALPKVSKWIHKGNRHIAKVTYHQDGWYKFDIDVVDQAGNRSKQFIAQEFYIDQTNPTISIQGVRKYGSYKHEVAPIITFKDVNFDRKNVKITLHKSKEGDMKIDGTYKKLHNGVIFKFNNFDKNIKNDDIYTLNVSVRDRAGNTKTKEIQFAINRFGSIYELNKEFVDKNGKFHKEMESISITEKNPTKLQDIQVLLFKNNKTFKLIPNKDYKLIERGGKKVWYEYTYQLYKENFKDDGVYKIVLHSKDEAGNVSENQYHVKHAKIQFGIDQTKPILHVMDLKDGMTYPNKFKIVNMIVDDNFVLSSIYVYLDGNKEPYKIWNAQEIQEIKEKHEEFTFTILGNSKKAHHLKIVCIDEAGNKTSKEVHNFYVTTDIVIRFFHNKVLLYGSIGILSIITLASMYYLNKKKVKKEE